MSHDIGRREIYTDERVITNENVIKVLRAAFLEHQINAGRIDYLLRYEGGDQPIVRIKEFRPKINTKDIDNIANEITEFKLGYKWGNPITLVQRGQDDSGNADEAKAIALLNEQYETLGIRSKTQQLARFIEICGIGYTFVDVNTNYTEGEDAFFTVEVLDPRYAFLVKSGTLGHHPMMGVTYSKDALGNYFFTCFTKDRRYEILNVVKMLSPEGTLVSRDDWSSRERSGEANPLGLIPIIEWIRSYDRMGCFERQISDMDALNILESDMINASSEQVDCIWHCNDVEFPEDENGEEVTPKSNDWVQTYTTRDGKTPFINPLSPNYDYVGNLNNVLSKRALILQKCNVPQRNDNSGGSTGIAMSDASGWSAAEASATKDEQIVSLCKMNEVKVVLRALKKSSFISPDNPMLRLRACDMVPNIKRQKSYELTNKANAIVTLLNAGFNGLHVIKNIPFFDDVNQAWEDSRETIEKIQRARYETGESSSTIAGQNIDKPNPDRIMQDNSDQTGQSPNLN